MQNQNIQLNIGDEIGFVQLKNDVDSSDEVIFFPVVEICERDGETAYRYQYPDGQVSRSAIRQSELKSHVIKIQRKTRRAAKHAPNLQICLSERKGEFKQALRRTIDTDFDVYAGWDRDTFFVVNKTKNSEYRVEFETLGGKVFAECECQDFLYRKRVCKHIAAVLQERMFGINLAV